MPVGNRSLPGPLLIIVSGAVYVEGIGGIQVFIYLPFVSNDRVNTATSRNESAAIDEYFLGIRKET